MKTIGIYFGNFQPPHKGHLTAYKRFKQITGPETFIVTTSKTPTPDAPLHFGEKENILVKQGVPASHIARVEDWKHPKEVFNKFSPSHTTAVFALNEKEIESLHIIKSIVGKDSIWTKSNGEPSYFQPYKGNESKMESLDKHGYVYEIDDNVIDGKPISTSQIRSALGSPKYTEEQKAKFFAWAFGFNPDTDRGLFKELCEKFKMAHANVTSQDEVPTAMPSLKSLVAPLPNPLAPKPVAQPADKLKQKVQEMVREILSELSPPPSMTPSGTSPLDAAGNLPSDADRRKEDQLKRQDAAKQKSASERDLKTLQTDLKWKESDIKRKKQDEIPDKRDEIDALNKSIATKSY